MIIHFNTLGELLLPCQQVGQKTREGIKMPGTGKIEHIV